MQGWSALPTPWVISAGHPNSVAARDDGCSIRKQNAHCWHHTQDSCPLQWKEACHCLGAEWRQKGWKAAETENKTKMEQHIIVHDFLHGTLRNVCDILPYKKRQTLQGYYSQKQPHILSTVTTQCAPQYKQTAEKLRRRYFLCYGFVVSQSVIAS